MVFFQALSWQIQNEQAVFGLEAERTGFRQEADRDKMSAPVKLDCQISYQNVLVTSENKLVYLIAEVSPSDETDGGAATATGIIMTLFALPGGVALALGSYLYTIAAAVSPYRMVIYTNYYEVLFSYDNVYYTHCYHEIISSYDSGNHLIGTNIDYYQAIGG